MTAKFKFTVHLSVLLFANSLYLPNGYISLLCTFRCRLAVNILVLHHRIFNHCEYCV